jgi:glycosyltransferase involved in cell wall biosynthesis
VVINTRNAEQHLQQVLEAVKGFDEVLVCDMESEDATLDIARRNGCRIVTFPKADHKSAEPARTFAISQARYPWVLVVDADEIVTPELR